MDKQFIYKFVYPALCALFGLAATSSPAALAEELLPPPLVLAVPGAPTTGDWALPNETDKRSPWNRVDPWNSWGTSDRFSLVVGAHPFLIGGPGAGSSGGSHTQSEVGVAVSLEGGVGMRLSSIEPLGLVALSVTFLRNRGVSLYDLGLPDVAIGYAMVSPEFGVATDLTGNHTYVTAGLSLGGVRCVVGDLLSADVRLTPEIWLAPASSDSSLFSFSLGLTFDFGLVH